MHTLRHATCHTFSDEAPWACVSVLIASGKTQEYGRPYLSFMGNTPSNPTSCIFAFCKATTYLGVKASEEKVGSRSAHKGSLTELLHVLDTGNATLSKYLRYLE